MKKKLLIVSIVVIIVLLGSIVGILIYNNIQDKKEKAKIADAYRKAHAPKYIKFTDNAGNYQADTSGWITPIIKTVWITEYDKDYIALNEYHQCQGTLNNLDNKIIKTQKDTKYIQVRLWLIYSHKRNVCFNLKRNVAKKSKDGDTIYVTLSADFFSGIFHPNNQSKLPEYIKVRD